jgi:hypothetical protein
MLDPDPYKMNTDPKKPCFSVQHTCTMSEDTEREEELRCEMRKYEYIFLKRLLEPYSALL